MHELSIATELLKTLLDYQKKQEKSVKILEVHVRIGKLRTVALEQLRYCYNLLIKGTSAAGSKLIVEEIPAKITCPTCKFNNDFDVKDDSFHFTIPSLTCPRCGTRLNLEGGDELQITKIRMQEVSART
jgi:hydrogenase nickel incorporation protein HypA/HybF